MIEINLIPANLRKKQSQGGVGVLKSIDLPREILFGLGSLLILLLISIHLILLVVYLAKFSQQMMAKATWERMLPDKNNVDSINQNMTDLRKKLATVNDVTSKKSMLWSQKLNILSDALPKGLWFRKIDWTNNLLTVEGSAFSKLHDEITIVGNFVSSLKKEPNFSKDFISIEVSSVTRSKKGMTEIADFKITAKAR
jgi:hypothetical protein